MGLGEAGQQHQLADSVILMRAGGVWLHKGKHVVSNSNPLHCFPKQPRMSTSLLLPGMTAPVS